MTSSLSKLTNPEDYETFLKATSGLVSVGCPVGTFYALPPGSTGSQIMLFRSDPLISGIQIGNNYWGGSQGTLSQPYKLTATGAFFVSQIGAQMGEDNNILSYLEFLIPTGPDGFITAQAGCGIAPWSTACNMANLPVILAGIVCNNYINQLTFQLI